MPKLRCNLIKKDYKSLLQKLLAEFIGTFLYLSLVLLSGTLETNHVATAFGNGLLVASIVHIIGDTSGGHINPAVTIGVFIQGSIRVLDAILYIIVQIIGAILGSIVAFSLTNDKNRGNLGATVPPDGVSSVQVFGFEVIMTLLLVAVVSCVTNRKDKLVMAPFAIGLSITACQCASLVYIGSLNPVRSLGPAAVMNIWNHHWVFWIGPILGGIFAGLLCRILKKPNQEVIILTDVEITE